MWVWKRISKFGKIQKSFLKKCKNGDAKSDTNAVYVKAHNKKRLGPRGFGGEFQKSARSKLISSCHLQDDMWYYGMVLRSPRCPFFVVVASTFNTQRLPGLFHCGKRYRSPRLYLYKSEAPATQFTSASQLEASLYSTFVWGSCPI